MKKIKIVIVLALLNLLFSCGKTNPNKSVNDDPLKIAEMQKFSTISEITLGTKITDIKDAVISEDKDENYIIYILNEKEVNKLNGKISLYTKNYKIEKIMFSSSGIFLGSTSAAGFIFDEFYKEREAWIQDAMAYYDIPEWEESENFNFYKKNNIIHQFTIEKAEALGIQMGWTMNYIIASENSLSDELQMKKNNLKF